MKKKNFGKVLYSIFIYSFLYLPIIVLIIYSFNKSKLNSTWTGFTTDWYIKLFRDTEILKAMKNTLIIAFVSTIFSVVIGTTTAFGLYKCKFKDKSIIENLLYIPVVIPEIVLGIALLVFFSSIHNLFPKFMDLGIVTLIIAHVTFSVSYVVVLVKSSLEGFNKSIEEAAMDLGASPKETFFKVILPIILPGIISGGLLAFTLSLDDVIVSFFVAGPSSMTLPLKVFSMVKFGVTPEINALSTVMLIFSLIVVITAEIIKNKRLKIKNLKIVISCIVIFIVMIIGGVTFAEKTAKASQIPEINVFNWSEYLPDDVIKDFQKEYNIKVNYSTFSSNEEMLAKLMAGGSNYDLVVASDYMVDVLKNQKLIRKIDLNKIPNYNNIGEEFKGLEFDPNNEYCIPYMWGDACIAYDTSKIKQNITGFKDLWNKDFKNSIVILDDQRAIIGMALMKNGYLLNDTNHAHIDEAVSDLKKLQPNIKAYDSDSPKTLLVNGEASIGYVWGAEAYLAQKENKNIKVVIPKEGLFLQQDNFVVPAKAKNIKAAEKFMNYILRPDVSARISKAFPYANPNVEAHKIMDKSILKNIAVYPPKDAVEKGQYLKDIGKEIKYFDEVWSKIKQ